MAWYDSFSLVFRALLKTENKPKQLDHGANWNSPHGQPAPYDPSKALSSYGLHSWTHAAVSRQGQDLAALPLKLMTGKGADAQEIDEHPFIELMEFPSTTMDGYLFREQLIIDLRLTGNAYILLLGTSAIPTSLVRLHPGLVEITSDESGITGYAYDTGAGQKVVYPVDRVIHMRNASYKSGPQSEYGTGVVEVLAQDIDADLNAMSLASSASKRGHPSILISPTDPADIWDSNRRKAVLDQYQGLAKSGGAMALSGQANIMPLNISPKDMEFKTSREMARQSVGAVVGTPSTILSLESSNYATARQAAISYYQNLQKIGRRLELALTKIARLFDRSLYVKLDYSGIDALQSLRTEQLNRINLHILNGMLPADAYKYEGLADAPMGENAEPAPISEELIEDIGADDEEDTEEIDETIENFFRLFPKTEQHKKKTESRKICKAVHRIPEKYKDIDFSVPNGVKKELKKGLEWHEEGKSGDGLTTATVTWARRMANGADISPEKAVKMRAWLARHESDKKGEGFKPDEPGFPSAGRVAWALWGGDPAITWSNKLVNQMEKADEEQKTKSIQKADIEGKEIIDRVWKDFIKKQHMPTERKLQKATNQYLQEAKQRYIKRFREQVKERSFDPKTKSLIVEWGSFLGYAKEKFEIIKIIGAVWRQRFTLAGIQEMQRIFKIARKNPFDFVGSWNSYGEILDRYTSDFIDKMADEIAKTTARDLQRLVSNGLNEGLSIKDIALQISASKNFNYARGRLIARTEATRLHGNAGLQSIKDANSFGIKVKKSWIGNTDNFTRESHLDLIRKYSQKQNAIDSDEYFITPSGKKALTAGDFNDPAEDCNCRCTVKPVVIRD